MSTLDPKTVWDLNPTALIALLDSGKLKPRDHTIRFYAPSFMYYKTKHFCSSTKDFPTISVTGNRCTLNCKHCGGKVLQTMHPALSPTKLFELGKKLRADGAKGVLVSGGCLPDGSVPLDAFTPVLGRLKHELGLTIFVHTGITRLETAILLKEAGVDAALIDVIGSEETIRRTLKLSVVVKDYADSLRALSQAGLKVVPHVVVGLNEGKLGGEYNALKTIADTCKPSALVIIAFMPIHGTEMAQTSPPKPLDIARVTAMAKTIFPKTPLVLGCMRPKGKLRAETDVLALKAGVNAIAFPSDEAVEYVKSMGYGAAFSSFCCAQMYLDAAGT
jgi:uncharacterized radical SAM superfamily protein